MVRHQLFRHARRLPSLRLLPSLLLLASLPIGTDLGRSARAASGLDAIVKAFCLTAFESEMSQSGKTAPAGMADFACGCVADRISSGSSLNTARSDCRQATAKRYPI